MTEDFIQRRSREFLALLKTVPEPDAGTHEIEVVKVLDVGEYLYAPWWPVAIIEDTQGRRWEIPEEGELVSRWDVEPGTKLKLVVTKEGGENVVSDILEVVFPESSKGSV